MIWDKIKAGICFENSNAMIPWNMPLNKIELIDNPEIVNENGRLDIVWKNRALLDGINGNWTVSLFPDEKADLFKSIGVYLTGDQISKDTYSQMKSHLLELLGKPGIENETGEEREMKWTNGNYYIDLYLFEMHSFRLSLRVGID